MWLLQPVMFLNSACTCCLGLEPVPTSEYLTLCRPALQHSGRGRPVSEFPKCVRIVAFEIKALSVQQRTAFHQARSSCQACWPFRMRRGGGNGHGQPLFLPTAQQKDREHLLLMSATVLWWSYWSKPRNCMNPRLSIFSLLVLLFPPACYLFLCFIFFLQRPVGANLCMMDLKRKSILRSSLMTLRRHIKH